MISMDWTSILVAVITALGSFLGVYYANRKSSEKTKALLEYRLNQLENKMDKHNQVIERVYRLEEQQAVTCSNATITKVATLTIPAGTWWYRGVGNWSTNATGYRTISFENSIGGSRDMANTTCGTTGTSTFQSFSHTATYSSGTTLNLYAWQNSGGNLNVWPYIEAIRIA